ncbi:hypothetical protein PT974_07930 [Cladobotryum mycophilum]|uniref:Uncharacterized protein n=1 Tax=Cladobotryum mycophilum TaxID=491253 RepID=A0ABR0SD22_9HYPO
MTDITNLLADLKFIAEYIESLPAKFRHPKIKPSRQEADQFHELVIKIGQNVDSLQKDLASCATGWTPEIYQKADEHMLRAHPALHALDTGQVKGPILRRNLVAIFQGRHASSVDSAQVRARKKKRMQKCETLRSLDPKVILAWGTALPPSTWEEMDQLVFNDLVKQVTIGATAEIPSSIGDMIRNLGAEEPFCNIPTYLDFEQNVQKLVNQPFENAHNA